MGGSSGVFPVRISAARLTSIPLAQIGTYKIECTPEGEKLFGSPSLDIQQMVRCSLCLLWRVDVLTSGSSLRH